MPKTLKLTPYGEWLESANLTGIRSDYDGPPVEYLDGDAMACSMIPFGRIAYVVHFKDEPQYVYTIMPHEPAVDSKKAIGIAGLWRYINPVKSGD